MPRRTPRPKRKNPPGKAGFWGARRPLNYGRGGYEFTLADHPIASKQSAWVQLLDQSNLPLSPKVYFNTYEDCSKNLIIVNFKQVR